MYNGKARTVTPSQEDNEMYKLIQTAYHADALKCPEN